MRDALVRWLALTLCLCTGSLAHAVDPVPGIIQHQGRITVGGNDFGGTGHFKFAFVDGVAAPGTTTFWSNDGTSVGGSEPVAEIPLTVSAGLYSVALGDTTLMDTIPASVFQNGDVRLRIWFDDGGGINGWAQLSPDLRLTSVAYAQRAATAAAVDANAVTGAGVVDGSLTGPDLSAAAGIVDSQVSDALTISGGSLNATVIGATTAAAATFTNLTATGSVTLPAGSLAAASLGLLNGAVLVGNAANQAQAHALSGDMTMTNLGVVTIANGAVTSAKILDGTIVSGDLAANAVADANVVDALTISGGTIDNTVIGATTAAAATFTTIAGTSVSTSGAVQSGSAAAVGGVVIGDGDSHLGTIATADLNAARTYTLPNASGTVALVETIGATSANLALSNLAAVAINTALLPGAATIDLGSTTAPFRGVYLGTGSLVVNGTAGDGFESTLSFTDPTADRAIVFPDLGGTVMLLGNTATGSGSIVLATTPTLVTPVLGVATATSINQVTLTAPATGSTLTIADGKTLTASNTLTLAGTDATTMTFPSASDTVVTLAATQTLTNKTLTTPKIGTAILDTNGNELFVLTATGAAVNELTLANAATGTSPELKASGGDTDVGVKLTAKGAGTVVVGSTTANADTLVLAPKTGGVNAFNGTLTSADITAADKTWTLPNTTGTIALTSDIVATGASMALDNLAAVAINTALLPGAATIDLGSTTAPFRGLYLGTGSLVVNGTAGDGFESTLSFTDPTADRAIVFPDLGGTVTLLGNTVTGSGSIVLATTPTLVTPVLGVATATSINQVTLTAPATGSTLTIADGKTLTAANTLTLAGTDATTMTFPSASDTVVTLAATQTLTSKTLTAPKIGTTILDTNGNELFVLTATGAAVNELTLANAATGTSPELKASGGDTDVGVKLTAKGAGTVVVGSTTANADTLVLAPKTGGANAFNGTLTSADITASDKTWTLPNTTGTIALTSDIVPTGATMALDNLAAVAINTALLPGAATIDLGSTTAPFRGLYLGTGSLVVNGTAGDGFESTLSFTDPTADRAIVFPDLGGTVTLLGNTVTGSGSVVLATTPTLVTPVLGVATATSVTASGLVQSGSAAAVGSVVIGDGDSHLGTIATADLNAARTYTLPNASGTVALVETIGATSANLALSNLAGVAINTALLPGAATIDLGSTTAPFRGLYLGTGSLVVNGTAGDGFESTLSFTDPTADRAIVFPDLGGTVTLLGNTVTGSGSIVLATTPTLVTPVLGVATATSINQVTLTAPATGSTLTIADGKTLTASNTLTLAGTDATTMTFPSASDTVVTLAATQTLTNKTLTAPKIGTTILDTNGNELVVLTATGAAVNELTLANAATGTSPELKASGGDTDVGVKLTAKGAGTVVVGSTTANADTLVLAPKTGGANAFNGTLTSADITVADKTWTLPNATGTIALTADILATKLDDLAAPDDNTDLNVSTSVHGLVPKAPNDTTKFLRGDGTWDVPAGSGPVKLDDAAAPDDNTDLNVSTSLHGLTPKAPNDPDQFLRGDASWALATVMVPGGRLTTESGVWDSLTDRTSQGTLYYTPCVHNRIRLYSGSTWKTLAFSELSLALTATSGKNYDVFVYDNAGSPTLELGAAWSGNGQAITGATNATPIVITATAHGLANGDQAYVSGVLVNTAANGTWTVANVTANTFELAGSVGNGVYTSQGWFCARASSALLTTQDAVLVKSGATTRRYVGLIRASGANVTEDSRSKRFVWNLDNQRPRLIYKNVAATHTYTLATIRAFNNSTSHRIEVVVGLNQCMLDIYANLGASPGSVCGVNVGFGENTTTAFMTHVVGPRIIPGSYMFTMYQVRAITYPYVGYNFYQICENVPAADGTVSFTEWTSSINGILWD